MFDPIPPDVVEFGKIGGLPTDPFGVADPGVVARLPGLLAVFGVDLVLSLLAVQVTVKWVLLVSLADESFEDFSDFTISGDERFALGELSEVTERAESKKYSINDPLGQATVQGRPFFHFILKR